MNSSYRNTPTSTPICHSHQAGVALITVLLVVFLASVAAASLASVQQLAIRRSALLLHQQQARLYTFGAEQWAMAILKRDRQQNKTDSLNEDWAQLPPALPIEGGSMSGRIQDLQGRLNLNNLLKARSFTDQKDNPTEQEGNEQEEDNDNQEENKDKATNKTTAKNSHKIQDKNRGEDTKADIDKEQLKILQHLLDVLELNPEIAQAVADWLDPDQETRFAGGAEDSEYTVLTPPYLAANRRLTSLSELRLIKGIDKTAYDKLSPHVCVLPPGTPINVNTITAPVLMALGDGIDAIRAEALVEDLKKQGFDNVATFLTAAGLAELPPELQLEVRSNYFSVQIEARVGEGRATLYSILERSDNGSSRVLMRSFGNEN